MFSLSNELLNTSIQFLDDNQKVSFLYNHDNTYNIACNLTNWKETKIKKIDKYSKYYKLIESNNYYYNNDDNKYMIIELFKIKMHYGFLNSYKKEYIIMIINNPLYDENSIDNINKGKYKLLLFSIIRYGAYNIFLKFIDIFTSAN